MKKRKTYRAVWECPSNIALIKYWGKRDRQFPLTPSVSFSLKNARTKTKIEAISSSRQKIQFLFEGKTSDFAERVEKYIDHLQKNEEWIKNYELIIESSNTFPHAAGIASSASAFGALALCLADLKQQIYGEKLPSPHFFYQASQWARLGSGSACRSVFPQFAMWGKLSGILNSTDYNAVPIDNNIHPDYFTLNDAILMVDSSKKKVSSSAGHQMMNNHPLREVRIKQAILHSQEILLAMKRGDHKRFFSIIEKEALNLHAMMMTSKPSFTLLQPNSLSIIQKIRDFRQESDLHLGFTIDAGPNIHLIYFENDKQSVHAFIETELSNFTEHGNWLDDAIGNGPQKLIK